MKAKTEITAEMFKAATGRDHEQDDLERCNCPQAGTSGHNHCGWNYKHNCPMYESTDEVEGV